MRGFYPFLFLLSLLAGCAAPPGNVTIGNITPAVLNVTPAAPAPANITPTNATPPPIGPIISPCDRIPTQPKRDECVMEAALRLKETPLCAQVENSSMRENCVFIRSGEDRNASGCLMLAEQALVDRCVMMLLPIINDSRVCALVGPAHAEECGALAASLALDAGACLSLSSVRARDLCLQRVATTAGDVGACSALSTPSLMDSCISAIARARGNASLCQSSSSPEAREACSRGAVLLPSLAQALAGTAAACEGLGGAERDACLYNFAVREGSVGLCARIAEASLRGSCLEQLPDSRLMEAALNKSNPSAYYCGFVDGAEERDACLEWASIYLLDSTACALIGNEVKRDACLSYSKPSDALERVVAFGDPGGCVHFEVGEHDECLARIASSRGEPGVCAGIINEPKRMACALSLLPSDANQTLAVCSTLSEPLRTNCTLSAEQARSF